MSAIVIPNARLEGITKGGDFVAVVPSVFVPGVEGVIALCQEKHAGFGKLTLDRPFRPRTFGPGSQSAHLHGHLQQLAIHFGYTLGEMKMVMKGDVPEWPMEYVMTRSGRKWPKPESEANVSTTVEARAVEWTHMVAGEEGLVLVEGKEE